VMVWQMTSANSLYHVSHDSDGSLLPKPDTDLKSRYLVHKSTDISASSWYVLFGVKSQFIMTVL
jgi:hypothetical protein